MERLTEHSKQTSHENGICCTHFRGPECLEVGGNCAMNCKWEEAAWSRLAAYEDTRLTPERCAEFARADAEGRYIIMRDAEQEGVARLRELAGRRGLHRILQRGCNGQGRDRAQHPGGYHNGHYPDQCRDHQRHDRALRRG